MSEKIIESLNVAYDECKNEENHIIDVEKLIDRVNSIFETCLELSVLMSLKLHLKQRLGPETTRETFINIVNPFIDETIDHGNWNVTPRLTINLTRYMEQFRMYVQVRGIDFNLMIVGRSGTGKSTLLNTLFNSTVARTEPLDPDYVNLCPLPSKCEIKTKKHIINDDGFKLRLSLYDTVGYGDLLNNEQCFESPLQNIQNQLKEYHENEKRGLISRDQRIHCVIYVIQPTGHKLMHIDMITLKKLSEVANVIPVIGRADSLEPADLEGFRKRVRDEIEAQGIICYPMRKYKILSKSSEEDEAISKKLPLACIGANFFDEKNKLFIRRTPFGDINLIDSSICDNELLKDLIIRKNLHNLLTTTHHIYYGKYRETLK